MPRSLRHRLGPSVRGGVNTMVHVYTGAAAAVAGVLRGVQTHPTLRVSVDDESPRSMWSPHESQAGPKGPRSNVCTSTRVPVVRSHCLKWALAMEDLQSAATWLWTYSEQSQLGSSRSVGSLQHVVWPKGLKQLEFSGFFR
ncbi:unnamed protein product [Pylaiella littoralis]